MNLPPYTTFPICTGMNVIIRQVVDSDIENIIDISFYDGFKASSKEQASQMLARINQDYLAGNSIHWAIIDKQIDKIVGTCGYYRGFEGEAGELGCILIPQYEGKGLMTEALKLAIDFGTDIMGLKRIFAITNNYNSKAKQLLHRLNFKKRAESDNDEIEYEYINTSSV